MLQHKHAIKNIYIVNYVTYIYTVKLKWNISILHKLKLRRLVLKYFQYTTVQKVITCS